MNRRPKILVAAVILTVSLAAITKGQTYTEKIIHSFSSWETFDGRNPRAGLTMDKAGNLYGTTMYGGAIGYGSVFKVDTTGKLTVLYSFSGVTDGATPSAALIMDVSDNLYGTTYGGAAYDQYGTVFSVDMKGSQTVLHHFVAPPADGTHPSAPLVRDADGNLFGTTYNGGSSTACPSGCGTVFRVDSSGIETVLHSFGGGPDDGAGPSYAGLVMDAAGNLYGTTSQGGVYGLGIIFELDKTGKVTVLHSFTGGEDGAGPLAGLLIDPDGNFYGTTPLGGTSEACGSYGCGTIFKLDTSGKMAVLANIGSWSPLIMDANGNLYATNYSQVLKFDKTGVVTVLHSFGGDPTDGYDLWGGLVMDSEGNLYGTTLYGGAYGYGTVFELQISQQLVLSPATSSPATGDTETLTATAKANDGTPLIGIDVTFTVTGVNPTTGIVSTDTTGKATFSYVGTNVGTDTVVASAVINGNSVTSNQATVKWEAAQPPSITSVSPTSGTQGQTIDSFTVMGNNFQSGAVLSFSGDAGIHVNSTSVTATQITANISISIVAGTGPRDLTVSNPDGQSNTLNSAFVTLLATPPPQPAINVSPITLTFGTVEAKHSQTLSVTIANPGTAPLLIYGASSLGNVDSAYSFIVSNQTTGVINPGSSGTITVTFSPFPSKVGAITATLGITTNAPTGNTYVPMTGTATVNKPFLLLPIDWPLTSSGPPLDIQPIDTSQTGNKISSGFTVRNISGTWFEVSLDPNDSNGPPHPKAPNWLTPAPTAQQVPNSFLIGPGEILKFPQDGTDLQFSLGQYLLLRGTSNSWKASGAFALDMFTRGMFGVQLHSSDFSTAILAKLADDIGHICLGSADRMIFDAAANDPRAVAWDDLQLLGCLTHNSPALIEEIAGLLSTRIGTDAAAAWLKIAPKLGPASIIVFDARNFLTLMVPLTYNQLTAHSPGWVLLQVPLPDHR